MLPTMMELLGYDPLLDFMRAPQRSFPGCGRVENPRTGESCEVRHFRSEATRRRYGVTAALIRRHVLDGTWTVEEGRTALAAAHTDATEPVVIHRCHDGVWARQVRDWHKRQERLPRSRRQSPAEYRRSAR